MCSAPLGVLVLLRQRLGRVLNGALKNERVNRTEYLMREHARKDIVSYIELRYNQIRLHSGIDYRTPNEVEPEWFDRNKAA